MASTNLFLDRSRSRDDKHPVCIRVGHLGRQYLVTLQITSTKKDYEKAMRGTQMTDAQKALREAMLGAQEKARLVMEGLKVVTIDAFRSRFLSELDVLRPSQAMGLRDMYDAYIRELDELGQVKTSKLYVSSRNSVVGFMGGVSMQQVDAHLVRRYEQRMSEDGLSRSTVSIYLRCLRCIFNRCMRDGLHPKFYPFREVSISSAERSKDALFPEQVMALWEYVPQNDSQRRVLDYFFFSYLCSGMNMADVFLLRWRDVQGDKITFERQKTVRTRRVAKQSVVYMSREARAILERNCAPRRSPDGYVFPLYDASMGAEERYRRLMHFQRGAGRMLQRIGGRLGFGFPLTLGIARHSFATCMKMMNYDVALISDMLQHSNLSTTQHYLKSIPDAKRREISDRLLDFKQPQLKAI